MFSADETDKADEDRLSIRNARPDSKSDIATSRGKKEGICEVWNWIDFVIRTA